MPVKATTTDDNTNDTNANNEAPALEQVPGLVQADKTAIKTLQEDVAALKVSHEETVSAIKALQDDVAAIKTAHDQTTSVIKFLCGRLGVDPQNVLKQVSQD